MNTIRYGGWTDGTYLLALPPSREAAKLNIKLTTLNELNGVVYEVSNAIIANHRGFHITRTTGDMSGRKHLRMELQRLVRASFRANLFTITSIIGAYVVVTDTPIGSRNARRLLDEARHLNYYCR